MILQAMRPSFCLGKFQGPLTPHFPYYSHKNPIEVWEWYGSCGETPKSPPFRGVSGRTPCNLVEVWGDPTPKKPPTRRWPKELLRIQVPNMECFCLDFMRPEKHPPVLPWRWDDGEAFFPVKPWKVGIFARSFFNRTIYDWKVYYYIM